MNKDIYVADFETIARGDMQCVWAYAITSVYDAKPEIPTEQLSYILGTDLDSFFNDIRKIKNSAIIYFHNLKYDVSYILYYLLKNGYKCNKDLDKFEQRQSNTFDCLISRGQFFSLSLYIDITTRKGKTKQVKIEFRDSLKKLPAKVKDLAESFNLDVRKGEIDYNAPRPEGYQPTDDEWSYVKRDVGIVAKCLYTVIYEQGHTAMTIGSDALCDLKKRIRSRFEVCFPPLDEDEDREIRKGYRGGFTYVNPNVAGKDITDLHTIPDKCKEFLKQQHGFTDTQLKDTAFMVFDVNSLYPHAMMAGMIPIGIPIYYKGEYNSDGMSDTYPLYIQKIRASFKLKPNKLPMVQDSLGVLGLNHVYLTEQKEPIYLTLTSIDLEFFFDSYECDYLEFIEGWAFRQQLGQKIFGDYIEAWGKVKAENKGAKRYIAKLMLNNIYGKLGTSPLTEKQIPYLDENDVLRFERVKEMKDSVYIPAACFITSYARKILFTAIYSCWDRFLYCDTDSIHILAGELPEIDIHPSKLGAWKCEGVGKRARYLRAKAYLEELTTKDGEIDTDIKCCGMSEDLRKGYKKEIDGVEQTIHPVTWDNFHIGLEVAGNLRQRQHKGGIKLTEGTFKIREK